MFSLFFFRTCCLRRFLNSPTLGTWRRTCECDESAPPFYHQRRERPALDQLQVCCSELKIDVVLVTWELIKDRQRVSEGKTPIPDVHFGEAGSRSPTV